MKPSVVILAFNSAESLPATLASLTGLTDDIHVVDSGSTDETVAIAKSFGAQVLFHPFESYGHQRNWAIAHCPVRYQWQLHLDADERLLPELRDEIASLPEEKAMDGFFLARYVCFLGRVLKHGGMSPTWHMRLFKTGKGHCEEREYDQHFLCDGATAKLSGAMIDDLRMPLTEWTARHNRWADAEVREQLRNSSEGQVQSNLRGNVIERKRALRGWYNSAPLFSRAFALLFYRYVVRLGFLDGKEGFIYWILQTFWFRFLIDAKIFEQKKKLEETLH